MKNEFFLIFLDSDYLANMPAENETATNVGLVEMGIEPGTFVAPNATVVIGISAPGVFPQPTLVS